MSAEHAMRWQHRPQPPRITSHWPADLTAGLHPGHVDECPICNPQEAS